MKVFLTGATGYIGSVVAEKLQAAGHSVIGLARNEAADATLRERGIEPHRGDLRDLESLARGARAADGAIHTAFIHDFNDFEGAVRVERAAIAAFVDALSGSGKPFIATSGTGLLGDTGERPVDEEFPVKPDFVLATRAEAEQDILRAAERGVRSVALRLPLHVYGRGGSVFGPMWIKAAREAGVTRYIASGENKLSAVHVDDAAQLYVLALEKASAGSVFHASAEFGITGKALAKAIGRLVGCKVESISIEEATATMGPALAAFMSINNQTNAAKAMQQLGWKPQASVSFLEDIEHGSYSS